MEALDPVWHLLPALKELMDVAEQSLDMRPEFRRAISKAHSAIQAKQAEVAPQKVIDLHHEDWRELYDLAYNRDSLEDFIRLGRKLLNSEGA